MNFEATVRKYNKPIVRNNFKTNMSFEKYQLNRSKSGKNKTYKGMVIGVVSVIIAGITVLICKDSLKELLRQKDVTENFSTEIVGYQDDVEITSPTEILDFGEIVFVEPKVNQETSNDIVTQEEIDPLFFDLSELDKDTSFKAYMDYRTITNETSKQYALQTQATTDDLGFRRYGEDFMVAVGTRFASECGVRLEITLDSGVVFTAVTGDIKQDIHTDATNSYRETSAGANVVEFIIDKEVMDANILDLGSVSKLGFEGNVLSIRVLPDLGLEQNHVLG